MDTLSNTTTLSLLALGVATLGVLLSFYQARSSVWNLRFVQSTVQLNELQQLHTEQLRHLKQECEDLRGDLRRSEQHADRCEAELARLKRVLNAHGLDE